MLLQFLLNISYYSAIPLGNLFVEQLAYSKYADCVFFRISIVQQKKRVPSTTLNASIDEAKFLKLRGAWGYHIIAITPKLI